MARPEGLEPTTLCSGDKCGITMLLVLKAFFCVV